MPFKYSTKSFLFASLRFSLKLLVVVVHHVEQGGEAPVVEEAALLMGPEPGERCRAVHVGRRAVGLERVDARSRSASCMIVARLGEERRYVAGRALPRHR